MVLIELLAFCGIGYMTGILKSIAITRFIKRNGRRKKKKRQVWMKCEIFLSTRHHLFKLNISILPGDFYSRVLKEPGEELYELLQLFFKGSWTWGFKHFSVKPRTTRKTRKYA